METLHQLFASLDIFTVLIKAFPSIFNPLVHSLQALFIMIFSSLKHLVTLYPGLIFGTMFMSMVYFMITTLSRLRKARA